MANRKVIPTLCPFCGSEAKLIDSRVLKQGRRRKYLCGDGHSWSVFSEPGEKQQKKKSVLIKRTFNDEQIKEILLSTLSNKKLAAKFSVSHGSIAKVRAGETYADLYPEIDRASLPSKVLNKIVKLGEKVEWEVCENCVQWDDKCCLGFPEQLLFGSRYANECSAYLACQR